MSKKRLEEAKLMAEMLRVETRLPHDFPFDLVEWLVEQAERVQELEKQKADDEHFVAELLEQTKKYFVAEILEQNRRYRAALEFYADRENYEPDHYDPDTHDYTSMIDHDKGATARKALEG